MALVTHLFNVEKEEHGGGAARRHETMKIFVDLNMITHLTKQHLPH